MRIKAFPSMSLCLLLCSQVAARSQDMDKELASLAEKLATEVKDHAKKKVTVLDFTDLQGNSSELGKYIAEQLTVELVIAKKDFSVLDRANLKSILAEHKLTATGLVDPDNAKKLGMFAGVDALILGNIIPKGQRVSLTAKVITTDTAEIIGAARAEFTENTTVKEFLSRPALESKGGNVAESLKDDPPAVSKTFGDLRIELDPLHIVNGNEYLLKMSLSNQNAKRSIWVALQQDPGSYGPKGELTDSSGRQCRIDNNSLSGIQIGRDFVSYGREGSSTATLEELQHPNHGFTPALEIRPKESSTATIKFRASSGKLAEPGVCNLQIEFLLGHDFNPTAGTVAVQNLVCKINSQ